MELKLAAIDLGTVSSRLMCATVDGGRIAHSTKHTVITDLGEGVDANGVFSDAAMERVVAACEGFAREARAYGATVVSTTLTSAARDVSNGEQLLGRLRALGLAPQVIPGEIEARLTFYGVAHDFAGERIAVADSGGGSTELVVGAYGPYGKDAASVFDVSRAQSLDIGCRRVTERFFTSMPPTAEEVELAIRWMRPHFDAYWAGLRSRPDRLIAVGGTVTSLVAMVHELAVYDSRFVHLRDLTLAELEGCIARMGTLDVEGIAALPGVQAKRAPVLLAGAVIVRELMRAGSYDRLTVSENSLLAGVAYTMYELVAGGGSTVIGWTPELSQMR